MHSKKIKFFFRTVRIVVRNRRVHTVYLRNYEFCQLHIEGFAGDGCRAIAFQFSMAESAALIIVAGVVFVAPFLFLSALGGEVADRFDTAWMAEKPKLAEIAAAGVSVSSRALSSVPGLMVSWFWLIGAIILSILPTMVKEVLGGSEIIVTSYLAIFAVALGAGRCFDVSRC